MQTEARVVIVGGGIAGASIAYHLAELGWREIIVLEQGELISGTTSHAPGLVGQLRTDESLTKMLIYSVSLYRTLKVDGVSGYQGEGGLRLASSKERLNEIKQQAVCARNIGLEAQLLTPEEAGQLFPLMTLDGVEGALFIPKDGSASAPLLTQALITAAKSQGVAFHPHTKVQGVELADGRIRAVGTTTGRIQTENLVVAAGIWSPHIGNMMGISIPLTPMQHQYVVTGPLDGLADRNVPNLREPDKLFYLRQREQSLVIGGYERKARPFNVDDIPDNSNPTVQPFDPQQFEPILRGVAERIPVVAASGFLQQVNGLEAFTPDGIFLLGPAPRVQGLWVACGFCAHGVSAGGGVGKVIAEWIVNGDPGLDVQHMSLARFGNTPPDRQAIQAGASQVYGTYYDLTH